ncbi:hypothetical protein Tco_1480273, partial [Tanacetum coccineum]
MGRADHFVYRIDIVDSLCDKFPIPNDQSSGSTTSHFDFSLPDYEVFYFDVDHQEEKSSGSTTSYSNLSLPIMNHFALISIIKKGRVVAVPLLNPIILFQIMKHFALIIKKKREVAVPLLTLIFLFLNMNDFTLIFRLIHLLLLKRVDPGELTRLLIENSSSKNVDLTEIKEDNELKPKTSTKKLSIHELYDFHLLLSNYDSTFSEEFSEIDFLVSFLSENKDKIFDPRIFIFERVYFKRSPILPLNDFSSKSFVSDLLLTDPSQIETFLSFPFGNEDKVFDLGILLIDEVFSFTRKSPHLLDDNFKNDKSHILSEISLKT